MTSLIAYRPYVLYIDVHGVQYRSNIDQQQHYNSHRLVVSCLLYELTHWGILTIINGFSSQVAFQLTHNNQTTMNPANPAVTLDSLPNEVCLQRRLQAMTLMISLGIHPDPVRLLNPGTSPAHISQPPIPRFSSKNPPLPPTSHHTTQGIQIIIGMLPP